MALLPMQARRSSRRGRGSNGRNVQLDKLGDVLTAPTRQAKKRFAPSDGLSLPNNLLAPVPKKRRSNKVLISIFVFNPMLMAARQRYHRPQHHSHAHNRFPTSIPVLDLLLHNHPLLYLPFPFRRLWLSRPECCHHPLSSLPLPSYPLLPCLLTLCALPPLRPVMAWVTTPVTSTQTVVILRTMTSMLTSVQMTKMTVRPTISCVPRRQQPTPLLVALRRSFHTVTMVSL
jgi:hypothetical protein